MPVIMGKEKYPENIIEKIEKKGVRLTAVNALRLAEKAGSVKAVNVVLIGLLAKNTDIKKEVWEEVIKETVPEKFLDINLKAFGLGYDHE